MLEWMAMVRKVEMWKIGGTDMRQCAWRNVHMVTYMHICVLCQRVVRCYKLVETKENTLPSEIEEGPIAIVTFAIFSECISCYLLANLIEACYYHLTVFSSFIKKKTVFSSTMMLHYYIDGSRAARPHQFCWSFLYLCLWRNLAESVISEGRSTP